MSDLRIHQILFVADGMCVAFSDGHRVVVPLTAFPRLCSAPPADRAQWQLIGRGLGVHWETLDEDLSVENILLAYSRSKVGQYAPAPGT